MIGPTTIAGILVGAGVFAFFAGLASYLTHRRWQERLRVNIGRYTDDAVALEPRNRQGSDRIILRMHEMLRGLSVIPGLRRRLQLAGIEMLPSRFLFIQIMLGGIVGLIAMLLAPGGGAFVRVLALVVGLVLGYNAMWPVLTVKRMLRMRRFDNQLPDAIDVLAGALEAGSSLPQALNLVAREMPEPISTEFGRVVVDQELGLSQQEALKRLVDRVPNDNLDMLVTAINIQYRVGGNLAQILRTIAFTIRERLRIKREIKVLTSQGRISAKLITVVPFGLTAIIYMMDRAYMSTLFTTTMGRVMCVVALVMIAFGYFVMNRIVSIKV